MKTQIKKYIKQNLVVFSVNIEQKQNVSGLWKKEIAFPPKWAELTLQKSYINENYNGLALSTGKINDIIVIDIDNIKHWKALLKENNQEDPITVSATSGSGGLHYYFKYEDDLKNIKSSTRCFGKKYDIDIRNNGGCIIVPPSKYYNNNIEKNVKYEWKNSIFDYKPSVMPNWIKTLLNNNIKNREKNKEKDKFNNEKSLVKKNKTGKRDTDSDMTIEELVETKLRDMDIEQEDEDIDFSPEDVENLVAMISVDKCNDYDDWLHVGMCLYNINRDYLYIWRKWSMKSSKYEEGGCEKKWRSFKKTKEGKRIGSLLRWAKIGNPVVYETFMKRKKLNKIIDAKFPDNKLILGDTVAVNSKCNLTHLHNSDCLIKGKIHDDMPNSMYIETLGNYMSIKCKHPECFGKTYPCDHIQLTKHEMNIAFNNVTININNGQDDELVEFQHINIFDDEKVNELVYNGLNGASNPLARIIYYYHKDKFNYGEDENWYTYENNKWSNIGKKNTKLRSLIQTTLKVLYSQVVTYYKQYDNDKKKISMVKQIIKNFEDTTLKNNIMTELVEIYSESNNPKRNFIKKLDANSYLIGFENGIYDLKNLEFREGKPNDLITMTVGYDYKENHTEKHKDLLKFLEDIQPNKEEREYMLTYLSIGLIGNMLELFTILTGCGRNGKSKLIELLKVTLGDYYGSVQSQLFTRPRPDANSPDPGLLSLAKKRIVIASEPEKNAKLNTGFIKFITGRDSTTLRNCHSNDMVDFSAKFITFLICNDIPDCDDIDNAFSKRLRCINFPTEFVLEPIKSNQKKINMNINENFEFWKLDFILLLIEYYKKYSKSKELKPTENILKWTDQYKENTDIYLTFLNECTEEADSHIKTSELYEYFKEWFRLNNPHTKIPNNREFVTCIKKHKHVEHIRVGKSTGYGIKNLKINSDV